MPYKFLRAYLRANENYFEVFQLFFELRNTLTHLRCVPTPWNWLKLVHFVKITVLETLSNAFNGRIISNVTLSQIGLLKFLNPKFS